MKVGTQFVIKSNFVFVRSVAVSCLNLERSEVAQLIRSCHLATSMIGGLLCLRMIVAVKRSRILLVAGVDRIQTTRVLNFQNSFNLTTPFKLI